MLSPPEARTGIPVPASDRSVDQGRPDERKDERRSNAPTFGSRPQKDDGSDRCEHQLVDAVGERGDARGAMEGCARTSMRPKCLARIGVRKRQGSRKGHALEIPDERGRRLGKAERVAPEEPCARDSSAASSWEDEEVRTLEGHNGVNHETQEDLVEGVLSAQESALRENRKSERCDRERRRLDSLRREIPLQATLRREVQYLSSSPVRGAALIITRACERADHQLPLPPPRFSRRTVAARIHAISPSL